MHRLENEEPLGASSSVGSTVEVLLDLPRERRIEVLCDPATIIIAIDPCTPHGDELVFRLRLGIQERTRQANLLVPRQLLRERQEVVR